MRRRALVSPAERPSSSLRAAETWPRLPRHAGSSPASSTAIAAAPPLAAMTRPVTATPSRRGKPAGATSGSASTSSSAMNHPAPRPAAASAACSISIRRSSCVRLAPSAARTASSRRRATPAASSRLATLAHATSSSSTTPAASRDERRLHGGHRLVEHPHELHVHRSALAEEQIVDERARDAARRRGPFRRRLLRSTRPAGAARWRGRRALPACSASGTNRTCGVHRRASAVGKAKPGGVTPMISWSRSSRRMCVPDGVGAAAEPLHPEAVAQDDDAVPAGFLLGLVEEPAEERPHAQDRRARRD